MKKRCNFVGLSCALTGEDEIDERLAAELEQRIRVHYGPELEDLLEALDLQGHSSDPGKALLAALGDVDGRHLVAREILRVWFTGLIQTRFEGLEAPRTPEQWERGLLWSVIHAPAPGFSHNAHGVWASQPPQLT